jgi:hypothetical protein
VCVTGAACGASLSAWAAEFNHATGLNGATRESLFAVERTSPAYTWTNKAGTLLLAKSAGTTSGGIAFRSRFEMSGDFTVTVDCQRTTGKGSAGLRVRCANGFTSVCFTTEGDGPDHVRGTCSLVDRGCRLGGQSPASATRFRLRRQSGAVFADRQAGDQWHTLLSAEPLYEPVAVELFLDEDQGVAEATAAIFAGLVIVSAGEVGRRPSAGGRAVPSVLELV